MKGKIKAIMFVMTFLAILFIGPLFVEIAMAQEYVTGIQDDTLGVWLFSAGTTVPGGAPTDDIIERAAFYDILDYIGDTPAEIYDFGWGPIEPTTGQEDKTLAEVIQGLSAIDDFGMHANAGDDDANFDTGSDGYFVGGFDPDDQYIIVADGVKATGVLGPSGAANATAAEEAIDGYEIFIFEDAELSGMIVTLSNYLGLSITFSLTDLQVDPPTANYADDTLIAIDLDKLTGFDASIDFIDTIRIEDDSIPQPYTNRGDTTLEIDAIATRKCARGTPAPQRLWTTDIDGVKEIDEFPIGTPVYLKTSDDYVGSPLEPGKYRIWLFEGNIIPSNGMKIPDDFGTPLGLTPFEVTTTADGRFDVVKIWDIPYDPSLICNDYSVILDRIELADGSPAPNQGVWGTEDIDYRDDLCTAKPTPPSFHVIPEVVFGTIVVLTSMFGSLGIYVMRRKKNHNHK